MEICFLRVCMHKTKTLKYIFFIFGIFATYSYSQNDYTYKNTCNTAKLVFRRMMMKKYHKDTSTIVSLNHMRSLTSRIRHGAKLENTKFWYCFAASLYINLIYDYVKIFCYVYSFIVVEQITHKPFCSDSLVFVICS